MDKYLDWGDKFRSFVSGIASAIICVCQFIRITRDSELYYDYQRDYGLLDSGGYIPNTGLSDNFEQGAWGLTSEIVTALGLMYISVAELHCMIFSPRKSRPSLLNFMDESIGGQWRYGTIGGIQLIVASSIIGGPIYYPSDIWKFGYVLLSAACLNIAWFLLTLLSKFPWEGWYLGRKEESGFLPTTQYHDWRGRGRQSGGRRPRAASSSGDQQSSHAHSPPNHRPGFEPLAPTPEMSSSPTSQEHKEHHDDSRDVDNGTYHQNENDVAKGVQNDTSHHDLHDESKDIEKESSHGVHDEPKDTEENTPHDVHNETKSEDHEPEAIGHDNEEEYPEKKDSDDERDNFDEENERINSELQEMLGLKPSSRGNKEDDDSDPAPTEEHLHDDPSNNPQTEPADGHSADNNSSEDQATTGNHDDTKRSSEQPSDGHQADSNQEPDPVTEKPVLEPPVEAPYDHATQQKMQHEVESSPKKAEEKPTEHQEVHHEETANGPSREQDKEGLASQEEYHQESKQNNLHSESPKVPPQEGEQHEEPHSSSPSQHQAKEHDSANKGKDVDRRPAGTNPVTYAVESDDNNETVKLEEGGATVQEMEDIGDELHRSGATPQTPHETPPEIEEPQTPPPSHRPPPIRKAKAKPSPHPVKSPQPENSGSPSPEKSSNKSPLPKSPLESSPPKSPSGNSQSPKSPSLKSPPPKSPSIKSPHPKSPSSKSPSVKSSHPKTSITSPPPSSISPSAELPTVIPNILQSSTDTHPVLEQEAQEQSVHQNNTAESHSEQRTSSHEESHQQETPIEEYSKTGYDKFTHSSPKISDNQDPVVLNTVLIPDAGAVPQPQPLLTVPVSVPVHTSPITDNSQDHYGGSLRQFVTNRVVNEPYLNANEANIGAASSFPSQPSVSHSSTSQIHMPSPLHRRTPSFMRSPSLSSPSPPPEPLHKSYRHRSSSSHRSSRHRHSHKHRHHHDDENKGYTEDENEDILSSTQPAPPPSMSKRESRRSRRTSSGDDGNRRSNRHTPSDDEDNHRSHGNRSSGDGENQHSKHRHHHHGHHHHHHQSSSSSKTKHTSRTESDSRSSTPRPPSSATSPEPQKKYSTSHRHRHSKSKSSRQSTPAPELPTNNNAQQPVNFVNPDATQWISSQPGQPAQAMNMEKPFIANPMMGDNRNVPQPAGVPPGMMVAPMPFGWIYNNPGIQQQPQETASEGKDEREEDEDEIEETTYEDNDKAKNPGDGDDTSQVGQQPPPSELSFESQSEYPSEANLEEFFEQIPFQGVPPPYHFFQPPPKYQFFSRAGDRGIKTTIPEKGQQSYATYPHSQPQCKQPQKTASRFQANLQPLPRGPLQQQRTHSSPENFTTYPPQPSEHQQAPQGQQSYRYSTQARSQHDPLSQDHQELCQSPTCGEDQHCHPEASPKPLQTSNSTPIDSNVCQADKEDANMGFFGKTLKSVLSKRKIQKQNVSENDDIDLQKQQNKLLLNEKVVKFSSPVDDSSQGVEKVDSNGKPFKKPSLKGRSSSGKQSIHFAESEQQQDKPKNKAHRTSIMKKVSPYTGDGSNQQASSRISRAGEPSTSSIRYDQPAESGKSLADDRKGKGKSRRLDGAARYRSEESYDDDENDGIYTTGKEKEPESSVITRMERNFAVEGIVDAVLMGTGLKRSVRDIVVAILSVNGVKQIVREAVLWKLAEVDDKFLLPLDQQQIDTIIAMGPSTSDEDGGDLETLWKVIKKTLRGTWSNGMREIVLVIVAQNTVSRKTRRAALMKLAGIETSNFSLSLSADDCKILLYTSEE